MKRRATGIFSIFLLLLLVASFVFPLVVSATEDDSAGAEQEFLKWSPIWNELTNGGTESHDEEYFNSWFESHQTGYIAVDSITAGKDILMGERKYYVGDIPASDENSSPLFSHGLFGRAGGSDGERGFGSGGNRSFGGRVGVGNRGRSSQMPFVTQNSGSTKNYNFNMPTSTYNNETKNFYNSSTINNITYNQQYNTYNFVTNNITNNYVSNYYVTYAPTFVNITYLDSASGSYKGDVYYYQMPDGRNSFALKSSDVFGEYFVYDFGGYETVVEDERTRALYHFDDNLYDSSSYGTSLNYTAGGSYNFVEHTGFGGALYLDKVAHSFGVSHTAGAGTYEFMLYLSEAGSVPTGTSTFEFTKTSHSYSGAPKYSAPSVYWAVAPDISYFLPNDSNLVYVGSPVPIGGSGLSFLYEVIYYNSSIFGVNGSAFGHLYERVLVQRDLTYLDSSSYRYFTDKVSIADLSVSAGFVDSSKAYTSFSVGSWMHVAVSGGAFYVNGVAIDSAPMPSPHGNFTVTKPLFYSNYWMVDEFRSSSDVLYRGAYHPRVSPFDTNKVKVLPSPKSNGHVAIKNDVPVGKMRIGGVRPTYPVKGDIYIYLEKSFVKSIQQFDGSTWVETVGSIYVSESSEWIELMGYNMAKYAFLVTPWPPGGGVTPPSSSSSPSGSSSGGSSGSGSSSGSSSSGSSGSGDSTSGGSSSSSNGGGTSSSNGYVPPPPPSTSSGGGGGTPIEWGGFFKSIVDFIAGLFNGIIWLVTVILDGITTVFKSIWGAIDSLIGFGSSFGNFLAASFVFIPAEIIALLVLALSLAIIRMIIQFFK